MDPELIKRVAEGVFRREYSLLLGAGASLGAIGGNGEPLPSGPELLDQLVSDFAIETEGQAISLRRAYEAAKRKDPEKLEAVIRGQFTHCKPSWQSLLAQFQWHRVWTLNIDDVIETVLRSQGISCDRFNWTSAFRDSSRSECQVVHLHGFAKNPEDDGLGSSLVFSMAEYATTLMDARAWHRVFADEFTDHPFIVLGASLSEEFDLQPALSKTAATSTWGFPSVIVLKEVNSLERDELEALGLTVVEASAHEFMARVQEETERHARQLGGLYGQFIDAKAARFLQQFIDLRRFEPHSDKSSRGFYLGFEPQWKNILDDDDAELKTTEAAFAAMRNESEIEEHRQQIHILTGIAGTGKSTGLLRVARHFIASGSPTFLFRGEEDLDIAATIHWLKRMPRTVLVFDNCAEFADSFDELAVKCESEEVRLLALGAERTSRRSFLAQKIAARFLCLWNEYQYRGLTDVDIDSLLDKLSDRRRLGRITRWNRTSQEAYFTKTAARRLFEGMANLEGGQGFRTRIKKEFEEIEDPQMQRLYAAACVAYELGYPLPMGVAVQVSGMGAIELAELGSREGQDLLLVAERGVRPSHRITASLVVAAALSPEMRFEAMERLAFALAPHTDSRAIVERTRPYRLLRRLMDQETVKRLLRPDEGRRLYEIMEGPYDWNGRFWEQRALFESDLGNHAQARSYAEHSISIHRHPFAFNTLGTILGRIAMRDGDAEVLRESIVCLEYSRDERRWDPSEHPYVTFFSTIVRFGEVWGLGAIPASIQEAATEWFERARRSSLFSAPSENERFLGFRKRWLELPLK